MVEKENPTVHSAARLIRWLSLGGAIALLTLGAWLLAIAPDHPWRRGTISLITIYAMVTLTFLAGSRWAGALARPASRMDLWLSVLVVVLAPAVLRLDDPLRFAVMAAAFAGFGAWDSARPFIDDAPWYGRVRMHCTAIVVVALVLAMLATA